MSAPKGHPTSQFGSASGEHTLKSHCERSRNQTATYNASTGLAEASAHTRNQSSESSRQMDQYRRAMVKQIKLARQFDAGSPSPAAPRLTPLDSPGSLGAMTPVDLGERTEYFSACATRTSHIASRRDLGPGGGEGRLMGPASSAPSNPGDAKALAISR